MVGEPYHEMIVTRINIIWHNNILLCRIVVQTRRNAIVLVKHPRVDWQPLWIQLTIDR